MFEMPSQGNRSDSSVKTWRYILLGLTLFFPILEVIIFYSLWGGFVTQMVYYIMMPEYLFVLSLFVIFRNKLGKLLMPTLVVLLVLMTGIQLLNFEYSYILYIFTLIYAVLYLVLLNRANKKGETLKLVFVLSWMIFTFIVLLGGYVFCYLTADILLVSFVNLDLIGLLIWALIHVAYLLVPLLVIRNVYLTNSNEPVK